MNGGHLGEIRRLDRTARAPRIRTMRQFAEEEIIIPTGRHEDERFRVSTQPYAERWFSLVDSAAWSTYLATGPVQSGKTLVAFVIPILYHLFEVEEPMLAGVPDGQMAMDKYNDDLFPVLDKTRYREYFPRSGRGSRGGFSKSMKFTHGPTLKWLTAGGGDKSRAGVTGRVLAATEIDGYDESGNKSRETDKLSQMVARTESWGPLRRIYLECTLTTKAGRTWQETEAGTGSELLLPCPHCREHVRLDRDCLHGWEDAETEDEAAAAAYWACPECGGKWSRRQLEVANRKAVVVHRGQRVERVAA